jgi:short-subunit dehydrogenase
MRPPVDGGTVVTTRASSGIGRELTVQLAPRAGKLVLLARRAALLEELRTELMAPHPQMQELALPADLSDEGAVDRVLGEVHAQVEQAKLDWLADARPLPEGGLCMQRHLGA